MRFLILSLVAMMASTSFAQNIDDITGPIAWNACQQAEKTANQIKVNSSRATTALGKAGAALGTVPAEYASDFQRRYDALRTDLGHASRHHGTGSGYLAMGNGAFGVIKARVATGNWLGVTDASDSCSKNFYKAIGHLNNASMGYGHIESAAADLEREIIQFVSMLEAFEDWYGDSPDYDDYR